MNKNLRVLAIIITLTVLLTGCFSAVPKQPVIESSYSIENQSSQASFQESSASESSSKIQEESKKQSDAKSQSSEKSNESSDTPQSSPSSSQSQFTNKTTGSQASAASKIEGPKTPPQPIPPLPDSVPKGKYVVGYFASWTQYNNFYPEDVDASKLTHINYAFAEIGLDNKIKLSDPTVDVKNISGLNKLKQKNSKLKILISVGGWSGSKYFSNAALTSSSREAFAQSCADFITKYSLDGVDIDWEFPVSGGLSGNINRPEDKQNFTKLLQAIRDKLNALSTKNGKKYYLTIAGAASADYLRKIELQKILPLLDYIFIMGYDMHGPWDSFADLNAPLYVPDVDSPQYTICVNDSIKSYLNAGTPASKLVLGMPFYGYTYSVTEASNNGWFSPFSKGKSIGYSNVVSSYLNNSDFTRFYNAAARVPYLYGNNTFVSYEDAESIAEKVKLAKNFGLAGVGAWELSHDRDGVLLSSAYNTLY